jgi:small-conductance mechanosensitive channel
LKPTQNVTPIEFVGPDRAMRIFGVRLIGFDLPTLKKLALTVALFVAVLAIASALRAIARALTKGEERRHTRFLAQQIVSIVTTLLYAVLFISIWLDDPARFAGAAALITAGLAVALQKFVMSLVAYFAILRGNTFRVGDRIVMGGIRGDVIALGYIRTSIMEMGQPPPVQSDDPAMWVEARQYTGRLVSVTNDKIFDQPVYNFTREFPYLFEEIHVPIRYGDDRSAAERILLEAAQKHTVDYREMSRQQLEEMRRRYFLREVDLVPRVYYRLTDNWLDLAVRFIVPEYGIREVKDKMARDILARLEQAKIAVASSTMDVTVRQG